MQRLKRGLEIRPFGHESVLKDDIDDDVAEFVIARGLCKRSDFYPTKKAAEKAREKDEQERLMLEQKAAEKAEKEAAEKENVRQQKIQESKNRYRHGIPFLV